MRCILAALLLLLFVGDVGAASRYVRQGASGANNGTDWTNAYTSLPAALTRGDTYYIADGSYGSYTFDDAESGSTIITIKKATASSHGTETGWDPTYGDGQATFNRIIRFDTGFYVFDGAVRNDADWFDGASYGFRVYHNGSPLQLIIIGDNGRSITISNTYVDAQYKQVSTTTTMAVYAIDSNTWGGIGEHTGLIFRSMFVRGTSNHWFLRNTNGAIVEYSASEGAQSTSANHGEVINLYYTGANAIVRFNKFRDEYIGYGGTAIVAITDPNNETANGLQFYGNVVWDFESSDAAIGFNGYKTNNNKIYNNTFIRGVGFNSGTAFGTGTGNQVYNNLWINCSTVSFDGTHNYNAFSDANARGEANAQVSVQTSIFTNYGGNDFTLASHTNAGVNLGAPYNVDLRGVTRSTWDRGAYEQGGLLPAPNLRWSPL